MKRLKTAILAVLMGFLPAYSFVQLNIIDTPAPDTLLKGQYDIYFSAYENGGIKAKIGIGLLDWLTLGISEDIGDAIGDSDIRPMIPGVMARFNILKSEDGFGWGAGYDNFIEGDYGKFTWQETNNSTSIVKSYTEIIYGFYTSFSLPFKLFEADHRFDFGLRFPLLPIKMPKTAADMTLFAGADFAFGPNLHISAELENLGFDSIMGRRTMINGSIRYVAGDVLSVSLVFRYLFNNPNHNPSRSVIIEYQNIFF